MANNRVVELTHENRDTYPYAECQAKDCPLMDKGFISGHWIVIIPSTKEGVDDIAMHISCAKRNKVDFQEPESMVARQRNKKK